LKKEKDPFAGRYRIKKWIGNGTFSIVCLAVDQNGEPVVGKGRALWEPSGSEDSLVPFLCLIFPLGFATSEGGEDAAQAKDGKEDEGYFYAFQENREVSGSNLNPSQID
jgi:hypothetical protein